MHFMWDFTLFVGVMTAAAIAMICALWPLLRGTRPSKKSDFKKLLTTNWK